MQSLTYDVLGYKSDLKHTSIARVRAKDREKKAIKGLRFVEDELRVVKEEFQATREELCTKAAALDRARRALCRGVQLVTRGPPEAGGYDQPKGWSNSKAKG